MNRTYLCVLPLALFLAGSPAYSVAQEIECAKAPATTPKKCMGEPQAPVVNLNLKKLKASPQCVRVYEGTTIVFRLTPKKDLERDTVEIVPKDAFADSWLKGKNDVFEDLIIIRVPGIHKPDEKNPPTQHYYSIYLSNGECLDPRVEVQH